jgi:hypothetical protein
LCLTLPIHLFKILNYEKKKTAAGLPAAAVFVEGIEGKPLRRSHGFRLIAFHAGDRSLRRG